jgi:hypothetical protein
MKTWKPDTCDCIVEEIYQGTEIIGGGQVLRKCEDHSTISDAELYGVLYANPDGENKRKNQMLRILLGLEDVKGLGLEDVRKNADGSDAGLGLKQGVEYRWSFEGTGKNRVLKVEVKGANLLKLQKDAIKDLCDKKFGVGKVEIL